MSFKLNPKWNNQKIDGSSQIKEIAFDPRDKRLYVVFYNNSVYSYESSFNQFLEFSNAPSAGKYFHANLKSTSATKMRHAS